DQALDFLGPAGLLAACGLAVGAAVGGPGQHAVFGGDPALALVTKPGGDAIIEACGADHLGVPEPDEAGALRMAYDAELKTDLPELVVGPPRWTHDAVPFLYPETGALSTAPRPPRPHQGRGRADLRPVPAGLL